MLGAEIWTRQPTFLFNVRVTTSILRESEIFNHKFVCHLRERKSYVQLTRPQLVFWFLKLTFLELTFGPSFMIWPICNSSLGNRRSHLTTCIFDHTRKSSPFAAKLIVLGLFGSSWQDENLLHGRKRRTGTATTELAFCFPTSVPLCFFL